MRFALMKKGILPEKKFNKKKPGGLLFKTKASRLTDLRTFCLGSML